MASRFYEIIKIYNLSFCVRVCADSPLLDGNLIKKAISYIDKNIDIVTNVMPRTFPKGQSVEVINCNTFLAHYDNLSRKKILNMLHDIFTIILSSFNILNLKNDKDLSSVNLAIDKKEDYQRFLKLFVV